jgi:LacI family transcriptional regulator
MLAGGNRMTATNIRAVAAKANVSAATASRALNGNPSVAPELAERVFRAAAELGYQTPAARDNGEIVFIVPKLGMSYYAEVANGTIDTARKLGRKVVVMTTGADAEQEKACLQAACTNSTAGVIFTPVTGRDPYEIAPALRRVPLVIIGPRKVVDGVPHVYQNNTAAGYLATKYLLHLGHRRIAFIANFWLNHIHDFDSFMREYHSPAGSHFSVYDRYTGYCRALEEENVKPDPSLIVFGGFSYESSYAAARRLMAASVNFDALLAPNDRCGAGVVKLLGEQGFSVPEKASLICLNGEQLSDMITPTLTIVKMHNYEMGVKAAEQLELLMRGENAPGEMIHVKLIIKGSTKARVNK